MVLERRTEVRRGTVVIGPVDRVRIEPFEAAARKEGAYLPHNLTSPSTILAAELASSDTLLGWIAVIHKPGSIANIRSWYVRPRFRWLGFGRRLLLAAIEEARSAGYQKVEIRTAVQAVSRLGFVWTGYERKGGNQERAYRCNL